jgi:ankyrin repeat protein
LSPLLLAILRQDVELVRVMAARGVDLTFRDRSGSTALMWAAFSETGDATLVEALLRRGADPLATNLAGESALAWAMRRGDTPAAAALRKAGASSTPTMTGSVEKRWRCCRRAGRSSPASRDASRAITSRCR